MTLSDLRKRPLIAGKGHVYAGYVKDPVLGLLYINIRHKRRSPYYTLSLRQAKAGERDAARDWLRIVPQMPLQAVNDWLDGKHVPHEQVAA